MDLIESFRKTVELLRSNLVLFLPPLILAYLIPAALALAALYIFAPILIVTANSSAPLSVLMPGSFVAIAIIVVLALLAYAYVLAGWTGMNKSAMLTGKTMFGDFWVGTKAYFGRILGGIVVLAVIYIILAVVGVAATFVVVLPLIMSLLPADILAGGAPTISPRTSLPEISRIIATVGNTAGVWLVILTLAGLVFLFTLFWVQSVALDDVGVLRGLARSISFVRDNFRTTLGLAALYIIAVAFTSAIFPGGGGGGGGGGDGGYGFSLVIPAPLAAIFRLMITTFFMLYMFVIYADKRRQGAPAEKQQ
jgi:uncharacterized membrane protein